MHGGEHAAPELTHEKHVGSDMLAQKAHVPRHPSMAWLMRRKVKNKKLKAKQM